MFSSPVLPGGPYAASGSAKAFLDLSNQKGGTSVAAAVDWTIQRLGLPHTHEPEFESA